VAPSIRRIFVDESDAREYLMRAVEGAGMQWNGVDHTYVEKEGKLYKLIIATSVSCLVKEDQTKE
jgi:hypothetical protein